MKHLSLIISILLLLLIQFSSAQIPRTISYQGVLTDTEGTTVPDGNYNLTFRLYDVATGGSALWTETQDLGVTSGIFNAILGKEIELNLKFDRGCWLGITINSGSELTPRIELTSSAYSLNTAAVDDSCITSGNITNGQLVRSINTLTDNVTLAEGSNISITPNDNTLTIAANISSIGNTLDQAYDQGGPGSGRIIVADAGALEVWGTDGVVFKGNYNSGTIPDEGSGTRMMWYPRKAAFRVGRVDSTNWDDVNIGYSSIAMGHQSTASGSNSFAMGYLTIASGDGSISMGHQTEANGSHSTAMGTLAIANGEYSTAIGTGTLASGYSATALGLNSTASGHYSTVMGNQTTASEYYSTAMGYYTLASGSASTAMGIRTTATGSSSTAIGYETSASGNNSFAMGHQTIASGGSSIAMGVSTTASGGQSTAMGFSSIARGMNSFAIGFQAKANHHRSIVIAATSSTGIADSISSGGIEQIVLRADGGMYFTNTSGQAPYETGRLINTSTGAYLTVGGVWTDNCDKFSKENFTTINKTELLEKVKNLEITQWNYKSESPDIKHIGPVAQDFSATFGVGNDDKSISTIDPAGIALVAIQELEKRTSRLKQENNILKEKITLLEKNMKRLQDMISK